jgi:ABC-type transport system involved in multi-copper enzyme maturation permease subunit
MRNILIIILYTLKELFARKLFIAFGIISTIAIGVIWLILANGSVMINQFGSSNLNFEEMEKVVIGFEISAILFLSDLFILIAIFSSANLIPSMLEKGTIDVFLSKPISRIQLISGKYLGGVTFVFLNMTYLVVGIFLVVSFYFNLWSFTVLLAIPVITFTFALLNIFLLISGLLTRGSALGMIITYFYFIVLSPILAARDSVSNFIDSGFLKQTLDVLYYILPQVHDIVKTVFKQILLQNENVQYELILYSSLFLIIGLSLSFFIFEKKDL